MLCEKYQKKTKKIAFLTFWRWESNIINKSDIGKLYFRLGIDFSVASHSSEIIESVFLGALNAELVPDLCLVLIVDAYGFYKFCSSSWNSFPYPIYLTMLSWSSKVQYYLLIKAILTSPPTFWFIYMPCTYLNLTLHCK